LFSAAADAAPLVVGQTQFPVAREDTNPSPGATDIVGFPPLVAPFVGLGFSGTLTSRALTNDGTNPFGPGALTFTYQLTNDATSAHVIHRMTIGVGGLPGLTDVSYQGSSPFNIAPTLADRSTADVIGFSFVDPIPGVPGVFGNIPPGGSSKLLVLQTNSFVAHDGFASIIDGTVAHVRAYAPLRFIPEPSTFVLGALGLTTLLGFIRRSNRRRALGVTDTQ
jgi:hypothetical protein